MINHRANTLAIDTTDDPLFMSDYFIDGSRIYKINPYCNWRFYVKAVVDQTNYRTDFNLTMTYPSLNQFYFGEYNVTVRFLDSSNAINATRIYKVTRSKIF